MLWFRAGDGLVRNLYVEGCEFSVAARGQCQKMRVGNLFVPGQKLPVKMPVGDDGKRVWPEDVVRAQAQLSQC
jgi:hypothetical protein